MTEIGLQNYFKIEYGIQYEAILAKTKFLMIS